MRRSWTLDVAAILQAARRCDEVNQQMQICTVNSYSVYVFGYYHQWSRDFSPDCRRCIVKNSQNNDSIELLFYEPLEGVSI